MTIQSLQRKDLHNSKEKKKKHNKASKNPYLKIVN